MTVVFGINAYVKHIASSLIITPDKAESPSEVDCILVLGCGVYEDGSPSPMLEDRLKRAVELYNSGVAPKIIMSGDHGQEFYDEVNVMKNYATNHGIPAEDVFMDHAGFSTYESVYRAKEIFCAKRIVVVTQQYHLYRALYIANRLGLEAKGVSSDYRAYAGQSYRDAREIAARCKDFLTCVLKPEPEFMGDIIPVSGNGNTTAG